MIEFTVTWWDVLIFLLVVLPAAAFLNGFFSAFGSEIGEWLRRRRRQRT